MKLLPLAAAGLFALGLGMVTNAGAAIDAKAAGAIMTKSACNACHQVDRKILGPSYKDVSAKYKGNAKAADLLTQKVRKGGAGSFGALPMPPNPKEKISDEDLKSLIGWILSL